MDSMAKEHLETDWCPYKQVKILSLSLKYTFALACRLFMSITDPNHVSTFSDPFNLVKAGTVSVPINIPGTAYNRALKGGKVIRGKILALIKERKKELAENKGTVAHDLLTHTLLASDENGRALDEMTIAGNILGLLIGSHDTTSSAITSVLKYLAEFPHVYNLVLQEQIKIARSKGPKDLLNWDDIKKMKYSWNVACESMRLLSPAQGAFREVIHEFTYKGFTIPKGWKTFWTVHSTHKNPKYFPDPEKFDPSRFEGNGPAPYTFVPFGGGPRMCAGREYARLQILVYMHNVVTRFKWEKAIPNEKITYQLSSIPVHGLPTLSQTQRERYVIVRLCCSHSLVISKPLIGFVKKLSLSSRRNVSQSSTRNLCLCAKRPIEPNGLTSSQNHTPHDSPLSGMEEVLGSYVFGKKKATVVAH
ncbi:hypothetical protein CMV_011854, partial [Castanea mollissima]